MADDARLTVLYDADCALCSWIAARLRRWDRRDRMAMIPLQQARQGTSVAGLSDVVRRYPLERSLHVVEPRGGVRTRGGALLAILAALPGGWLLRPWSRLPGVEPLLDVVYDAVASHRDRVGRLLGASDVACAVPPAPERRPGVTHPVS